MPREGYADEGHGEGELVVFGFQQGEADAVIRFLEDFGPVSATQFGPSGSNYMLVRFVRVVCACICCD